MKVTSVTRSGIPGSTRPWATKVNWVAGDVLDEQSYNKHMVGCTSVVHSIGILLENKGDYKSLFVSNSISSQNNNGMTYEKINRDTAIAAAQLAEKTPLVSSFIFLSAACGPPGVDARYLSTKREAEEALASRKFRSIILRPGFIFSEDSPKTIALALPLLGLSSFVPGVTKLVSQVLQSREVGLYEPLALHILATAVVQAIRCPSASGVFDVAAIKRLADEF